LLEYYIEQALDKRQLTTTTTDTAIHTSVVQVVVAAVAALEKLSHKISELCQ
jgi:hypothetical protein